MSPPAITGYRTLSEDEVRLMNEGKALAVEVGEFVERIKELPETDKRWAAIGQTDLQKGFMSLLRAIARPMTF